MTAEPRWDQQNPAVVVEPVEHPKPDLPWRRLAPGMLLVEPVRELIKFIPMLIVLIFAGRVGESGPPWGLIATGAVIALGISRYATTRYRITDSLVEVRRGVFQRKQLTIPRDRIRTVDVSAHPLQRLLKLAKVQIGTGTSHHGSEAVALDGLPASVAGPLRAELLHRDNRAPARSAEIPGRAGVRGSAVDGAAVDGVAVDGAVIDGAVIVPPLVDPDDTASESILARLDRRWIGYAPATLSGVITGAVLISLAWRIASEAQLRPSEIGVVAELLRFLRSTPVWLDVVLVAGAVAVSVTVLSVVGYVLSFWGYTLSRHVRGTLQVTRGLLTTRATTIEERRLHGVDRSEPLLLRWFGGARLTAIATGLRHRGSESGSAVLVPPAPLATIVEVESAVLGNVEIAAAALVSHGPAARRRRYSRALGSTALLVSILFAASLRVDWLSVPAWLSLAGFPVAALLARDRFRGLGHAILDDHLIARSGSLARHRTVLAVPGVIGVTLRQSYFQRRSRLMSLTATAAAGAQHYLVPDLPEADALQLARRLVPQSSQFQAEPDSTAKSGANPAAAPSTWP